jgi:competence protein ComEC
VVAGFAQVQFAVTIGLVPVIAGGFGSVSLVSALVNAVAIPLYTLVIVPVVLLGTAAVFVVPAAGTALLEAVAWLIEATWPLVEAPAALPFAVSGISTLPIAGWALLAVGALATLAPLPMPGRAAGLLIVIALGAWRPVPPEHGELRLAVLDVGQGLAAVVQTRRHVLVYDTGPLFRSGTDTGLLVVEPYLRSRGMGRVDLLVASHDDDDHVGGAASVSALLDVRARVASGRALDALGPVMRCRAGQRWEWDGVSFQWLHPGDTLLPGDNDRSCVLLVTTGSRKLLLAGDAERPAEQQMLDRGLAGPVDVVVVPHHGSRTSSSAAFVAALAPRWAVVSAGYRNRWGFPAASVVGRWETAGAQVPRTSDSGAIEFNLNPDRPIDPPSRWRIDHPRPWTDP